MFQERCNFQSKTKGISFNALSHLPIITINPSHQVPISSLRVWLLVLNFRCNSFPLSPPYKLNICIYKKVLIVCYYIINKVDEWTFYLPILL